MKSYIALGALTCAMVLSVGSCKHDPEFKVSGTVDGAGGKTLILSKADFAGRWIDVDSTGVGSDGSFSITTASPASPEIYRLSLGDRYIYFPVDSTETIHLESVVDKFGTQFTLTGSPAAEAMASFEQDLASIPSDSAGRAAFKRTVYSKYLQNGQGSILSYYVLTKTIDGKLLFDPENDDDARYYAAVATQFDQYRPDDPHGKMVRDVSLQALRRRNTAMGKQRVLHANELKVIDIALPDEKGVTQRLSDYVGKKGPVIVFFGMMNAEGAPGLHRSLLELSQRLGSNVTIYNVSLDSDQYAWRDAAVNLPWITVFDAGGMTSGAIRDYNVQTVPAFYIYSAAGELVDSATDLKTLEQKMSSL